MNEASPTTPGGANPRPEKSSASGPQRYRGQSLGLPASGSGSVVGFAPRFAALLVDCLASALLASLLVAHRGGDFAHRLPGSWSLVPLAVDYLVGLALAGQTLGMHLFGMKVVNVDGPGRVPFPLIVVRTALLFVLVPAVVLDRDGRGLHDRFTGTAVVRA